MVNTLTGSELLKRFHSFLPLLIAIISSVLLWKLTSGWLLRIGALYCIWYVYDKDTCKFGGRPVQWIKQHPLWKSYANRFPISLEKTINLDPGQKYILGYHPHGAVSVGAFFNFVTDATDFSLKFPGITPHVVNHSQTHSAPIYRELLSVFGIGDASRDTIRFLLKDTGHMVVLVVGGVREALMTDPVEHYLVLKCRKGFVRLAIETGAHLVPSYTFGENQMYKLKWQVLPTTELNAFQKAVKKIVGFPPLVFIGRGWLNLPHLKPVHTIVGKPIPVEKEESPSEETIDRIHSQYLNSLTQLFENHKERFGLRELSLKFLD